MRRDGTSVTIETTVNGGRRGDTVAVDAERADSVDVYRRTCEEARQTIDQQVAWNREIDDKAARLLRINVALAALVVTAISFGFRYGGGTASFVQQTLVGIPNWYISAGIASFTTSTAVAGVTYTKSSLKVGLKSDEIDEVVDADLSVKEFHRRLATGYQKWADHNRTVVNRNGTYVSISILALVYSVVFFLVGTATELGWGDGWTGFAAVVLVFVAGSTLRTTERTSF